MLFNLYCIFDKKTGVYLAPFPARSDTDACRAIYMDFANPQIQQTPIGRAPFDFDIACIARFDDESGDFQGFSPRHVTNIGELIRGNSADSGSSTVPS